MDGKLKAEILNDPILQHARREMTTFRKDQTLAEALESLQRQEINDRIVYFYVVDAEGRLCGVVPVRRLVAGKPSDTVGAIMLPSVVSIDHTATVLDACEQLLDKRLLALPVVDENSKPVGVADINLFADEVNALAQRHEVARAFQLIGVHVALGRKVSPWVSFKDRFPWLLCNIGSGILCAVIASRYELLISQVTLLAMFLTVVLALAESVSMQSMTITLQTLGRLHAPWLHLAAMLRKELFTSAMLGGGSGLLVGGIVWLWRGHTWAALAIGGSICLAIITACLLGVIVPAAIRLLRADPKIAAGPIVLAAADIATLGYYFNLSLWLLR